ncbi:hypothetical protein [Microbispora sp. NPDC046933]|uniref:hypothetical protein n=1 Tax=Microbispora sp. NPDC046933 TaxID=3155618 RepID=UPI0033C570D0
MRAIRLAILALSATALATTACQSEHEPTNHTPLPALAAPPYICDYIPLRAVELMTGLHSPVARGFFDLSISDGIGDGSCAVYQRNGKQLKVLLVDLSPSGFPEEVEENIRLGASPLPEIVPGSIGSYFEPPDSKDNEASALLVRGKAALSIRLEVGAEDRDNMADVVALMKLIAPKLITDASAPSKSPSPAPTKG